MAVILSFSLMEKTYLFLRPAEFMKIPQHQKSVSIKHKLKLLKEKIPWQEAEANWDAGASEAATIQPLKNLTCLPSMTGITQETAKNLKWKSLKWIITQDHGRHILRGFLKHPFKYAWNFLKSTLRGKP